VRKGAGKYQRKLGKSERVLFAPRGKWKQKKHFILECEAFKDSEDNYVNILVASSWDNLFSEGTVVKLGELIIKLNMKMMEMQKSKDKTVCPIGYL